MAMAAVGLRTHIWNNQIKTVLLLLGFPLLLLLLLGAFFAMMPVDAGQMAADPISAGVEGVMRYGYIAFIASALWFAVAWAGHTSMINAATGAQPLSRADAPELYNMLENLCISRGMNMPKLQIMETTALNAFASGINDKTYTVTLTRGIIDALERDELEAVMAHELSHIRHKDVRLLIVAVIFAGIITFACEMMFRSMRFGRGGGGRRRDGKVLLLAFALMAVGYVMAIVIRFAISRKREFLADAGAVDLTHNPDAMIRALRKISGHAEMPSVPDDVRQMMIENKAGFFGMFATHPPMEDRIKALVMIGGRDDMPEPSLSASQEHTAPAPRRPWQRRFGPWG